MTGHPEATETLRCLFWVATQMPTIHQKATLYNLLIIPQFFECAKGYIYFLKILFWGMLAKLSDTTVLGTHGRNFLFF